MYNLYKNYKSYYKSSSIPSHNLAVFEDYNYNNINLKNYLKKYNSLIFNNCNNITINIDSDISRIEFYNCKDINLTNKKILGGLIIKNSSINILQSNNIYNIELEYSTIYTNKNLLDKFKYIDKFYSHIFNH